MSEPTQPNAASRRPRRILMIVGIMIAVALTAMFVLALVIHYMLLETNDINWLEGPKRSSLSPATVATGPVTRRAT